MIKLKLLLIDDESDYCAIMENFFAQYNYEVQISNTLQEGLEKIESFHPDILILDNNLPDGRGWDHVDTIVENNPHLRVFLVSAYLNKENAKKFTSPNITILEKPLSLKLLRQHFVTESAS